MRLESVSNPLLREFFFFISIIIRLSACPFMCLPISRICFLSLFEVQFKHILIVCERTSIYSLRNESGASSSCSCSISGFPGEKKWYWLSLNVKCHFLKLDNELQQWQRIRHLSTVHKRALD